MGIRPGFGQADQFCTDLPELLHGGGVIAAFGGSPGFAAGEVTPRHLVKFGSECHVDGALPAFRHLVRGYDFGQEFEFGLDLILGALATLVRRAIDTPR